jgi:hypothetical protein
MYFVPVRTVAPVQISGNATSDGEAHPKDVDENKQLVLHQIAESNEEVIFYHSDCIE